jgi:hypothetical protein
MKLALVFFLIFLSLNQGITYTELQEKLLETITSPFVNLMFIYDSASERISSSKFRRTASSKGNH